MADGTVDGQSVQVVSADSNAVPQERVDHYTVPGYDGIGAQLLGESQSDVSFALTFFGIDADCESFAILVDRMQGTIITVVDSQDDTYEGILITGVSNKQIEPALHADGLGITGKSCKVTIRGKMTL
jgi:hypothetical protein